MKLCGYSLVFASAFLLLTACSKEDEDQPDGPSEHEVRAQQFTSFIQDKSFQLVSFYSDKPIDYVQEDSVVKSETNLWPHVKEYIKDDKNFFNSATGVVQIEQNTLKILGNDSATLTRNYKVGFNRNSSFIDFVDYNYIPTRYKLSEFKDDYFIIYLDFKDQVTSQTATIYSKFQLKP